MMEDKEIIFTKEDVELIKDKQLTKRLWEHPKWEEEIVEEQKELLNIYNIIIKVLRKYVDLDERYYSLVAIWIIGTYFHNQFQTYPYLFFNAMRGSGKSRILRLITYLSKEGCMLNSLTEAVMFRTAGTLGIDEFEGLNRKGKESLTELLNSAYKKGTSVKRMKKVKTFTGEEQQVEEFSVFRPIVIANISGMDSVLADRCFTIILNKSNKAVVTKKVEMYESDGDIHQIKEFPYKRCSLCSVVTILNVYNKYIDYIYSYTLTTPTTLTTLTTLTTQEGLNNLSSYEKRYIPLFNKIDNLEIDGRHLELSMPLLLIADFLGEEICYDLLKTIKDIINDKKNDDVVENTDISLIDFISQEVAVNYYISTAKFTQQFKEYMGMNEDWLNEKWMGRALKRLDLIKEKRRRKNGMEIILDYTKAQEKIKMFK